jgi:rare lipoprotein A
MAVGVSCRVQSLAIIALLGLLLTGCAGGGSGPGRGFYTVGSPYEVNGTWYHPAVDYHYDRTGMASWYGADFDGNFTANGEIYDMNQLTAAHATLPLPSIVRVVNLQNGRSLQLRVNDRGPFLDGRLIDVSRRSAQLLGFEAQGTAPVRVTIMKAESIAAAEEAMRNSGQIAVAEAAPAAAAAPETVVVAAQSPPLPAKTLADAAGPSGSIYIQAGAFAMRDNAERVQSRIARLGNVEVTSAAINGVALYRVRLGPVASAAQADRLLAVVVSSGYPGARIVGN